MMLVVEIALVLALAGLVAFAVMMFNKWNQDNWRGPGNPPGGMGKAW